MAPETQRAYPDSVIVNGTKEQAIWVAEQLSNWHAGCEYFFYVEHEDG